jgi:hypothetical protein
MLQYLPWLYRLTTDGIAFPEVLPALTNPTILRQVPSPYFQFITVPNVVCCTQFVRQWGLAANTRSINMQ